jgi:mannan endo-1,4-beta-mannosidase
MVVYKADKSTANFPIETIDSVAFQQIPKWSNRSQEAQSLLAYLQENVGKKILSGTHACVNYNTNEADWVHKHTGKYPAINTFDFIHDIYSSSSSWINYGNTTIWRNWIRNGGILSAMWHWNMLANDSTEWTCTPGSEPLQTSFQPSVIFEPTSEGYKTLIARIDQVARWLKNTKSAHQPVLWRPLHEAQGNWTEANPGTDWHKAWFWWGAAGPETFKELWKVMYDRMVNYHGLTNLIWIFNAGDSKLWYPGDEYVDIVAFDFYNKSLSEMHSWYDYFQQNYPGKLYAISEFGNIPKLSQLWADGQYWSFLIPWYDYNRTNDKSSENFNSTDHTNANIDWWTDALNQDCFITRDELPDFR